MIIRAALVPLLFRCNSIISFQSSCVVVTRYPEISTVPLDLSIVYQIAL